MKRLVIDLKEDCHGDITGRITLPADSAFTLECISEVLQRFSLNCGVPVAEILNDLLKLEKL